MNIYVVIEITDYEDISTIEAFSSAHDAEVFSKERRKLGKREGWDGHEVFFQKMVLK